MSLLKDITHDKELAEQMHVEALYCSSLCVSGMSAFKVPQCLYLRQISFSSLTMSFFIRTQIFKIKSLVWSYVPYSLPSNKFDSSTTMCKVSATKYPRCQCFRRFRVDEVCDRGFSSSRLSCREGHNDIVRTTIANQLVCFKCYTRMEKKIREDRERKVQHMFHEAISAQWQKKKIDKALKHLMKNESADIAALRERCEMDK